jgi:type I restriction enzyme S subunit
VELGEVLQGIVGGKSPRCHDRPPAPEEWGVLKVSAVQPLLFAAHEAKALPDSVTPDPTWPRVEKGDVLMTRSNTPDRVGLVTHVDVCPTELLLSDLVWKLVPGPDLDPRYLAYVLSVGEVRRAITAAASGTSASMKKLNHAKVRALRVPVPPREAQGELATLLDSLRDVVNCHNGEVLALRASKRAVLDAVFSGGHKMPDRDDGLPVGREALVV